MRLAFPLLAAVTLLGACRPSDEGVRPPPPATTPWPEVRLLGFRARRAEPGGATARPVFDAESPPLLVVEGAWPEGTRVRLAGAAEALPVALETREARTLVRVTLPAALLPVAETPDELWLERENGQRGPSWAVERAPLPESRPDLAATRARLKDRPPAEAVRLLTAALPALPAPARLWLAVDLARQRARLGPDEAVAGWEAAAEEARAAGVPTEVSRRLRAAASQALRRRDFATAVRLLDASEAAEGPQSADNPAGLARLHALRAYREKALGNLRRASELLESATSLAWTHGLDADWASTAQPLAVLLQDHGRHREALDLMERVAAWYAAHPDAPDGGATLANNRGWVLMRAMAEGALPFDAARARPLFEEMRRAGERLGDPAREAVAFSNLAQLALDANDLDEATRLHAAWRAREQAGPAFSRIDCDLLGATLELRRGAPEAARRAFEAVEREALRESGGLVAENVLRARHGQAQALVKLGRAEAAAARYDAVLRDVRALALQADLQGDRSPFLARLHGVVEEAIELALARGDLARTFDLVDATAAPALQSLRRRTREEARTPAERAEWEAGVARWLADRDALESARQRMLLASDAERRTLAAEMATRRAALARTFDALNTARSEASAASARDIMKKFTRGEVVLSFFRLRDQVHAVRVTESGLEHHGPLAPEALFERLKPGPETTVTYVVPGDVPAARDLAERWPGRPVALLPFAAWLLAPAGTASEAPLVVGDPEGNLPHARAESAAVAALLSGPRSLQGASAARGAVLSALAAGPRLFHYSGHGILDAGSAWEAHLRLTGGERLTVADVLTLQAPLGLVFLSGCETGGALSLSGRERAGLAEAFLLAGARAVVASVRPLDDAGARRVIPAFYRAGGAERPLEALATLARDPGPDAQTVAALRLFGRPR